MIKIRYSIANSMNLFQFDLFNDINPFFMAPECPGVMVFRIKDDEFFLKTMFLKMLQENVINLEIFLEMVENHKEETREIH